LPSFVRAAWKSELAGGQHLRSQRDAVLTRHEGLRRFFDVKDFNNFMPSEEEVLPQDFKSPRSYACATG
jgi:hypothetical protein